MKIIDRNGRLFGKISVIDLLVIAVVAVLAAALSFKSNQSHTGVTVTEQPIVFQIRARAVDDYLAQAIQVGDGVYDKDYSSGGRVLDPGRKMNDEMNDGTAALLDYEDTVDLLITVEGQGLVTGKSYAINRVYALGVNSSRTYMTKQAQFVGTVAEIF